MIKRRPRHRFEVRDSFLVRTVELHRPDVGDHSVLLEMPPDDALAVRRKERAAVVARLVRQAADVRAVGVHYMDLAEPRRILVITSALIGRKFFERKGRAQRAEHDLFSVGRIRSLRVVAGRTRQINRIAAVLLRGENVERRVVIPRVAPLFSAGAEFQLRFLFCQSFGIGLRRGEQNAIRPRLEKSTGRFSLARRYPGCFARFQIENVLLIKRVRRLALALKDQLLSVRRKITFAAPFPFEHELSRAGNETRFLRGIVRGERGRAQGQQQDR